MTSSRLVAVIVRSATVIGPVLFALHPYGSVCGASRGESRACDGGCALCIVGADSESGPHPRRGAHD
jgi:hypothetical protein